MNLQFKTKNSKQLEAVQYWIDTETEQILFGGAKSGGKSYLGAVLIFGDALIYPETHYFIARKELNDLRKFTIPTIHEVFKNWGLKVDDYVSFNGQDNCFNLKNGSRVYLIACKEEPSDPLFERFGSMQMTRGWIEEGGEVNENAKANLWISIGRWKNEEYGLKKKLLITCNPKKGWMKREFIDLWKSGNLPTNKKVIQAFANDNPYISDDYRKSLAEDTNTVRRQRLWEGNWEYDEDADSLISDEALSDTFSNTITKDGEKYLVVDVARLGQDRTILGFWEDLELYKIEAYTKQTTDITVQKIKDFAAKEKIPYSNIIIDDGGVGGGVVDHLFGVNAFVSNSSPVPTLNEVRMKQRRLFTDGITPRTTFANLKTQCGFKLAEKINERKIAFKVPDYRDKIIEEVSALLRQKDVDSEGKLSLKKKDDVKAELGKSPDIADMLLMRMFLELKRDMGVSLTSSVETRAKLEEVFERNAVNQEMNSNK